MGCISDSDLRKEPPPAGQPRPIGAIPARYRATATPLSEAGENWEYGEEVEIEVYPNQWLELPLGPNRLYWSGIEVKVNQAKWSGHEVVAALYPPRLGWFAHGPLRRVLKRSRKQREAIVRKALEARGSLRDLPYDPFEGDPGWWTARLNDPMRLHWENGQLLGSGYLYGAGQSAKERGAGAPFWYFGICRDPVSVAAAVLRKRGLAAGPELPRAQEKAGYVRIPRATLPDDPATLLTAAVWQALAGRRQGDEIGFEETVRRVYEEHLKSLGT